MDVKDGQTARGTGRGAPRGTYAVGDERRSRILDAAVEHFAQWGFHATSMARIAKDVGITQGGLLHHFRNKEALLVSVLEASDEHDTERFFAEECDTAAEWFHRLLDLTAYNSRRPGRTRMFNALVGESGDPDHPAHAFFTRRYRALVTDAAQSLRRGVDTGELRADTDCTAEAQQLLAVMDGLQLQWVLDPGALDMTDRLRGYLDRLYRGLSTAGTGLPPRGPGPDAAPGPAA
ncbi:TetR/AcrR family transcriptional regulator [Streptomyces sp. CB01881]|uniref:TetR/AcrR family transcriptional regulator n=1 Tax=Streptomyces sp. CB01881 TaxID=2078691 RepID=UPI000CDCC023|nr:TetR/AcrR family transcriptional regulator [Streptomyces sp. CB01881]AUY52987.1 TetR family transcriptional regulator [Streptomyces sp. CB01881]TYC70702.1 TetR/AcrR family transcriptional regulator [Streptomyces sp. CB01881]